VINLKIKICGITRAEDLRICERYGDLVGFINIKRSPRYVNLDEIDELVSSMKNRSKAVLIMESDDIKEIQYAVKKTGINTFQLHGLENHKIREIKKKNPKIEIINVIGLSEILNDQKIMEIQECLEISDFIIFDYEINGNSGGTGRKIPLKLVVEAASIIRKSSYEVELLLAGGIDSHRIETEGEILEKHFDYMDVNSGVEESPGVKSETKIKELVKVMR
jgi:phosphoribosylanthranilate isomerase